MLKSIYIQLYPNKTEIGYISNLMGQCRFVYNECLGYRIEKYDNTKESSSLSELNKMIVSMKQMADYFWLNDTSAKVQQQSILDQQVAFRNFFRD